MRRRSWRQFARGLRDDASVREALTEAVLALGHDAVFWECAPVSAATAEAEFQMVVLDSPALARIRPDLHAFPQELDDSHDVRAFGNLSGDAELVVPCRGGTTDGAHLAAFLRAAPREQVHRLWAVVGERCEAWWERTDAPLWLSTSGLGVSWVHIRLDRRPKYYQHTPFRTLP